MFAILNVEYKKFAGIFNIFKRQKIKIERVDYKNLHFYKINLKNARKDRINWNKVAWAAGREQASLIVPTDIVLPQNCPCKPFDHTPFMRHVFLNTALKTIKSAKIRPKHLTLGVIDTNAVAPDAAFLALELAATVRVVTADINRYEQYSVQALETTGAPLVVSQTFSSLSFCDVVVAPFGISKNISCGKNITIFDETGENGFKISQNDIKLPKGLAELIPPKISHTVVAAAVFERGRNRFAVNMTSDYLYINNIKLSVKDVASHIKNLKRLDKTQKNEYT